MTDVLVKDCRVDLAAFTSATLERVTFEGCRMTQSDLQDAACESVRFLGCDLSECDLSDARFRRSELRGCELRDLHGVERLRGVGLEWGDLLDLAPALAAALGIRLLDAGSDACRPAARRRPRGPAWAPARFSEPRPCGSLFDRLPVPLLVAAPPAFPLLELRPVSRA